MNAYNIIIIQSERGAYGNSQLGLALEDAKVG